MTSNPAALSLGGLRKELRAHGSKEKAAHSQKFMKAFPGGYGEGDRFLGITVPNIRAVLRKYRGLDFDTFDELFASPFHEERLLASIWFSDTCERIGADRRAADERQHQLLYNAYIRHLRQGNVNNWDIIDGSAPMVVGGYLHRTENPEPLRKWARSRKLWERRVAMMAPFYHIRKQEEYDIALEIAESLLHDEHDLIHKAVGWMLREIGNRAPAVERAFLKGRYTDMPRTMLRYAIEKFPEPERKKYLSGTA